MNAEPPKRSRRRSAAAAAATPAKTPKVLLLTPPMVQLNTPYSAVPVLAGFLRSQGVDVAQADLSLELALRMFTRSTLCDAQKALAKCPRVEDSLARTLFRLKSEVYINGIEPVVAFLQGRADELAYRFARPDELPEGPHFRTLDPERTGWTFETQQQLFGPLGMFDAAKMRCTLFLEDVAQILAETLDPNFALARYAEHLAVAAPSFDPILERLEGSPGYCDCILESLVGKLLARHRPDCVGITVPFPGTVYGAFRIARTIRRLAPETRIVLGGGYVNSELRELTDERVFDSVDFICYDEGFRPWLGVLGLGPRVRTRVRGTTPESIGGLCAGGDGDYKVPVSDYTGVDFSRYLQVVESTSPMTRLWSDGRWLKVQLAAGCYWHRCRFCDVALDYIGTYRLPDPVQAVNALQTMAEQTGICAFHFTDEAMPPALMRAISQEILRRKLTFVWWGNIRFDAGFTQELTALMARAGCIGVSAGLECAHDRLLKLMNKGITCARARETCENLAAAGILVHIYLMYGYPTQTKQETLEALDFVRQLFAEGLVQSAFWHRFALTVHSPLAAEKGEALGATAPAPGPHGRFALNEIEWKDKRRSLDLLGKALALAVYNYEMSRGLDETPEFWLRLARRTR